MEKVDFGKIEVFESRCPNCGRPKSWHGKEQLEICLEVFSEKEKVDGPSRSHSSK